MAQRRAGASPAKDRRTLFADLLAVAAPADVLAPVWFLAWWFGYAAYADRDLGRDGSLMARMHAYRVLWMRRMLARDNRMLDAQVLHLLTRSVSFFASSAILIVGGLIAVLGARDQAQAVLAEVPFAVDTPPVLWDAKMLLLLTLVGYAFFKFTWALRHFNYCGTLVAAAPPPGADDEGFVERNARIASSATNHFNRGIRAFYFALAALGWLVHPWLFALLTVWVVLVLYRREFRSRLLHTLSAP